MFIFQDAEKRGTNWRNRQPYFADFLQLYENEKLEQKKLQLLSQKNQMKTIKASSVYDSRDCRNQSGGSETSVQLYEEEPLLQPRTEHQLQKAIEMSICTDFNIFRNQSEANGGLSTKYTDCSSRNVLNPPIPRIDQEQARNQVMIDINCPKVRKLILQTTQKMKMAELKAIQSAEVLQLNYSNAIEIFEFDFEERLRKICSRY